MQFPGRSQFLFRTNDAHPPASATSRCFDDNRESDFPSQLQTFGFGLTGRDSREYRQRRFRHCPTGFNLVAHQTDYVGLWPNKFNIAGFADLGKVSRLGQEPVAGMNCVNIKDFCCTNDGGNIQITLRGRCRTNTSGFIGKTNMQRIAIDITMHRDRLMPISLHVQIIRQAISPRLAIRIFLNLRVSDYIFCPRPNVQSPKSICPDGQWTLDFGLGLNS